MKPTVSVDLSKKATEPGDDGPVLAAPEGNPGEGLMILGVIILAIPATAYLWQTLGWMGALALLGVALVTGGGVWKALGD